MHIGPSAQQPWHALLPLAIAYVRHNTIVSHADGHKAYTVMYTPWWSGSYTSSALFTPVLMGQLKLLCRGLTGVQTAHLRVLALCCDTKAVSKVLICHLILHRNQTY